MLRFIVMALVLFITTIGQIPAQARFDELSQTSTFNKELVDSVKKGVIAILAMGPSNSGFMQPVWTGSGTIFMAVPEENAAYALTNHHVAQGTSMLEIETWDHGTYRAQMVATEPGIDAALIRIDNIPPDAYEVNILGNSDNVVLGEIALAMGAPGSAEARNADRTDPYRSWLDETATMRVISGRQTDPWTFITTWSFWKDDLGQQVMTNCPWRFVTQSAINSGNSGGPLFNANGEVVGLNHAHFGPGEMISQNENYTIPINMAKNFAFQILDTGKYELPWFGMDVLVPPNINQPNQVYEFIERFMDPDTIEVYGVRKDSSAERAGLQQGDIIVEFDGREFPTVIDFRTYIFEMPIGKEIPVVVDRGEREEVELVMEVGVKRSYDSEFSL